jgi:hypothetical protein
VVAGAPSSGAGEPDDLAAEQAEAEAEDQYSDDDVAVSAAAGRTGDSTPRQVTRQQRVTGGTQRRPGTRKKRR